jgi:4-hydroxybenzoate polyprenyltransferase
VTQHSTTEPQAPPAAEASPSTLPPPEDPGDLTAGGVLVAAFKQLRPKQWTKNVFLLAALVFAREFTNPAAIGRAMVGFASFSLLASCGYVLNDYLDREADRKHPKKRFRPIASGALPLRAAQALMVVTLLGGLASAWALGVPFFATAVGYLVTTLSYSLWFKHIVILDVMFLALCYVWRVVGGAMAIPVLVSTWLFLCTAFFALFVGFNKRRAELNKLGDKAGTRRNLIEYNNRMLEEFQSIVTGNTVLCYSLYAVLGPTPWMSLTIPFVLYAVFRYIYLVEQRGEGGAPDETLLSDVPILASSVLYGITAIAVLYADGAGWLPELLAEAPGFRSGS